MIEPLESVALPLKLKKLSLQLCLYGPNFRNDTLITIFNAVAKLKYLIELELNGVSYQRGNSERSLGLDMYMVDSLYQNNSIRKLTISNSCFDAYYDNHILDMLKRRQTKLTHLKLINIELGKNST
jgi:Ran GTPase-activating protein (RanGAP) involved in mRNA processing and transport